MKVRAYTIEWAEKGGKKSKNIAAFDNYPQARAKAIEILKSRGSGYRHEETHSVDRNGLMCDHLRVKCGRHWHQVTIKYPTPTNAQITFW